MKRNFHPVGFLSALAIHIALIGVIFYFLTRHSELELTPKEPSLRFAVALSEIPQHAGTPEEDHDDSTAVEPAQSAENSTPSLDMSKKPDTQNSQDEIRSSTMVIPNKIAESVKRHYGDEFFTLSADEQKYILENLKTIRKINEVVGNRLLRSKQSNEIDPTDSNIVEFYLYPDGSISDLYLYEDRQENLLDSLTMDTIRLAHTKYPRPKTKTLIRIRVWILVKE